MRVVPITELVYGEPKPATPEEGRAKHAAILAGLNAPVYLGSLTGLEYDHKSDRYAASFAPGGHNRKLVLKASNEVAQFLAENIAGLGYWQGRMEAGVLMDVFLIYA
ncbi:MAG TPA: hypothetical protein VNW90_19185 [Acetobacteraceae bacterium]|nr:hypothetical protein [Acetobacteraceae bacterium]